MNDLAALGAPASLMTQDGRLAHEIRPLEAADCSASAILVTGPTGFLGRHIVMQLLARGKQPLVCLVRASDDAAARARLLSALAGVMPGLVELPESVTALAGDVSRERLGLRDAGYRHCRATVGRIVHCAAEVNWQRDYGQLRGVNVGGSLELIRFACDGPAKHVVFVSSVGVCFARSGSGRVDERTDMLPQVADLPMGYAQSKCVAESLFRQAAERGLPVCIVRAGLISGDTKAGNPDYDGLVSAMMEGCINVQAAPDIDWVVDCLPVDHVATVIARLTDGGRPSGEVLHLVHERGRQWRELVLWMNLYGYYMQLLPMTAWSNVVHRPDGPTRRLRRFRRFFVGEPSEPGAPVLPPPYRAYLGPEQRRVDSSRSQAELASLGLQSPPLDATLLATYLEHYAEAGLVRRIRRPVSAAPRHETVAALIERTMGSWLKARRMRLLSVAERTIEDAQGILSELAAARGDARQGTKAYDLTLEGRQSVGVVTLPAILKIRPRDAEMQAAVADLARHCNDELGDWFDAFRNELGLEGCHEREVALYASRDPRLARHRPACYGSSDRGGVRCLAIEFVPVDSRGARIRLTNWDEEDIAAALDSLGRLHAVWYGREATLSRQPWMAHLVDARRLAAMTPLWSALARFSAPCFGDWLGESTLRLQSSLARSFGARARQLEAMPRALIHNDFNPRNLVLRSSAEGRELCAFDWELATIGVPQRDLAEFLCFVMPQEAGAEEVAGWLDRHARALAANGAANPDRGIWLAGFRLALRQLLVDRFAMYALVHRFRELPYLPDVIRNWRRLDLIGAQLARRRCYTRASLPASAPAVSPIRAKPAATASRYPGAVRRTPQA